jgi:hypothetical protein
LTGGREGLVLMERHDVEPLEYLIIEIEPPFEPVERLSLAFVDDTSTDQFKSILKYDCSIGGNSEVRVEGQVQLSQAQAEAISALWQKMDIGLIPKDNVMGLDGTTTKVTIIQGMNKLKMEWRQNAPEPWKPVERLIEMLWKMVKDARTSP